MKKEIFNDETAKNIKFVLLLAISISFKNITYFHVPMLPNSKKLKNSFSNIKQKEMKLLLLMMMRFFRMFDERVCHKSHDILKKKNLKHFRCHVSLFSAKAIYFVEFFCISKSLKYVCI